MSVPESYKMNWNVSRTKSKNGADSLTDPFGFEAARNRLQEKQNNKLPIKEKSRFKPWRVFLNQIDSYHGKKIVETLLDQNFIDSRKSNVDSLYEEGLEEEGIDDESDNNTENVMSRKIPLEILEPPKKLEIIGTTKNKEYKMPEDVKVIKRKGEHDKAFIQEIVNCGYIIYDITEDNSEIDEALWVLKEIVETLESMERDKPRAFKQSEEIHCFILISTIMTWTLTKPLDTEDPDLPFTEADYRKRRCHANFKQHIRCEREVMSIKKRLNIAEKLKAVVLCCGITYGYEESSIDYLFKMGWMNHPFLPVFGNGNNIIPLLHTQDLVSVVSMFLKKWPKLRYVVAVEQESPSQKVLVKKISNALTTGQIKCIAKAEAFLLSDVSQRAFDVITTNIRIDPVYIVDHQLEWRYELPLQENLDAIVKEYKISRNLLPIKIIVLGPPVSGKTRLAKRLGDYYGIHYVHIQQLISETLQSLSSKMEDAKHVESGISEQEQSDVEDGEDDKEKGEGNNYKGEVTRKDDLQQQLDEIQNNLFENNGRLSDDVLNKLLMNRLLSKECQNQGYILDGYPKTLKQVKMLFSPDEGHGEFVEDKETLQDDTNLTSKILPDLVISLEASDEFLRERVINLSEREIQGTHYTEEHMLRRLREYRDRNTFEETPLQFFDELEIHPLVLSVQDDICPDMSQTFYQCIQKCGAPRKYDTTPDEVEQIMCRERAEAQMIEEDRKKEKMLKNKKMREKKMVYWTNLLQNLKDEEEEQLRILSEPLRQYLMKHVFPTLTQGLIQVAKLRPDDPVDYLAEYLFKENPEGKMFEPDYTETMNTLFDDIEKLQTNILSVEKSEQDNEIA